MNSPYRRSRRVIAWAKRWARTCESCDCGYIGIVHGTSRWWSQPVDATLYLRGKRWSVAMDRGFRRGFTTAEKTELWDRWQRGESLKAIGRAFGKPSSSIYFQVSPYGGIRPAPRRRSRLALTLPEREEISRGIAVHRSARSMACLLGRSPSTVSREISRNGGYDDYRAALADDKGWPEPAARNVASWRPMPGCDRRWPAS